MEIFNNAFHDSDVYVVGAHNTGTPLVHGTGNTYWNFYNNIMVGGECGIVAAESAEYDNLESSQFHHNTFADCTCSGENCIDTGSQTDVATTKSYAYNNLFYNVTNATIGQYCGATPTAGCVVHDNNSFLKSTGYTATVAAETSPQSDTDATSVIFTNYATGDYSIAAANQVSIDHIIGQGKTLASPFDIDYLGVTRTAPFDVGAYDVGGTSDVTAPTLAEVTPVSTPSASQSPVYVFSSDEVGIVTYGGACGNGTLSTAAVGNNSTGWNLGAGTYADCTITVTDSASNVSTPLAVTSFTVMSVTSSAGGGVSFSGSMP
jgi:hypothetical protein